MKRTPKGTPVGVEDPLDVVTRCDWVTQDGRCRLALERPDANPRFITERRLDDYRCPFTDEAREWTDCEEFVSRPRETRCARCGLEERPLAHDDATRSLLEHHHVAYPEADGVEITVVLCRWCHARVHTGDARIDESVDPPAAALAELQRRKQLEQSEAFTTAAERRED